MSADRRTRPTGWTRYLMIGMAIGILSVAAACGGTATPASTSAPATIQATDPAAAQPPVSLEVTAEATAATEVPETGLVVRVSDVSFPVELAIKSEDRVRGLSGRASLDAGTGMLFVFDSDRPRSFWMREMEIPLDMVWINSECRVVDISENAPPPDPETALGDLPRYSPSVPARFVLEINAGESIALGLGVGDSVEFLGELAGQHGC